MRGREKEGERKTEGEERTKGWKRDKHGDEMQVTRPYREMLKQKNDRIRTRKQKSEGTHVKKNRMPKPGGASATRQGRSSEQQAFVR